MLSTVIKGANKKGLGYLYLILYIVIIVVIIVVIVKVWKGLKTSAASIGESLSNASIALEQGITADRVGYLRQTAEDLWKNATKDWIFYYTYDEPKYIDAINSCSVKEVVLLDQFFYAFNESKRKLKDIMSEDWGSQIQHAIRTDLYNALK